MAGRKRKFGQIDQLPSGKFRARYTGPDGTLYKAPKPFFEEADAVVWLRGEEKKIALDVWEPPVERARAAADARRTVGDWIIEWLDLLEAADRKPSTMQSYRQQMARRVLEVDGAAARLRDVPLEKVRRRDIMEWWDAVTKQFGRQPYNYSSFQRINTALTAAVERELLAANPALNLREIKPVPAKRKELPELDMILAIIDEMPAEQKLIGVLTLIHGMRIGEALGMQRHRVVDAGHEITFRIDGNVWRKQGEGMVWQDEPKTSAGRREVPIFGRFHELVRHHLDTYVGDAPGAWLFTTPTGGIRMDTTTRTTLNAAKNRAGYANVQLTPHYGRVWLISELADQKMNPAAIGEFLGQKDLATITQTYMRANKARAREVYDRVGDIVARDGEAEGISMEGRRKAGGA